MSDIYEVVYPVGIRAVEDKNVAPSLPDLNGMVIGELWNHGFRGDETFPMIEDIIHKQYPGARFISYKDFGNFHDPTYEAKMMADLPNKIRKLGCNAVIVGNGC